MMIFSRFCTMTASACLILLTACSSTNNSTPVVSPPPSPVTQPSHNMSHVVQININNAILSELDKLEGKLGIPALSNQIQASRPYGSTEEIVSKKVLTQAQFDQIKDMITIRHLQK